ncbi:methyltransferase family protein [Tunturiibacter psychrotolerans]|uniref:methyltransferase family protein n=1 Tax=Tunturiibacter psychrotolerans TaxID=3069686 RepID=UPI003D2523A1
MNIFTVGQAVHWTTDLWLALSAVWLGSLPFVKTTILRQSQPSVIKHTALLIVGLYLLFGSLASPEWLSRPLFAVTLPIAFAGLFVVVCGVGFSIWARLILGENWSGIATIKQDHSLIVRGPYRAVRHPIYTGMLLALFGTALQHGLIRSFLGVFICSIGFWMKVSVEEHFMVQRFGNDYRRYRMQVSALVPFVF